MDTGVDAYGELDRFWEMILDDEDLLDREFAALVAGLARPSVPALARTRAGGGHGGRRHVPQPAGRAMRRVLRGGAGGCPWLLRTARSPPERRRP